MRSHSVARFNLASLGFAEGDVLAYYRIIAPQFKTIGVVLAILHRGIGMGAFGAAQFNNDAVPFFACHDSILASATTDTQLANIVAVSWHVGKL